MVGLPKDRFTNLTPELMSELECDICHQILLNPVMIPCCRTLYCRQCLSDWRYSNKVCFSGRHRLSPHLPALRPSKTVIDMLSRLKLHCNHWDHGCQQILFITQLSSHSRKCSFNPKRKLSSIEESSDEEIQVKKRRTWSKSNVWKFR